MTIENAAAEKKAIEVKATQDACVAQKAAIEIEKEAADKDLQAAMPFVYAAQDALSGIKPNDIVELKSMKKPHDICRLILDTAQILFMGPLVQVTPHEFSV